MLSTLIFLNLATGHPCETGAICPGCPRTAWMRASIEWFPRFQPVPDWYIDDRVQAVVALDKLGMGYDDIVGFDVDVVDDHGRPILVAVRLRIRIANDRCVGIVESRGMRAHGATPLDAYERALACDPVSAFGGIVAFNRTVDEAVAAALGNTFLEIVTAPEPIAKEMVSSPGAALADRIACRNEPAPASAVFRDATAASTPCWFQP